VPYLVLVTDIMADLAVPRNPSWPTDQADPASCSAAGEFFAMWLTTPEQIKARTYRGPGIDVTARYLRVLFGASTENWSDGQLVHWFQDTQAEAERRYATQPGSPDLGIFFNEYIKPAVDGCSASVCRSLGWQGNTDLAGIGVSAPYLLGHMAIMLQDDISANRAPPRSSHHTASRQPSQPSTS
jgi:hypothetical protein